MGDKRRRTGDLDVSPVLPLQHPSDSPARSPRQTAGQVTVVDLVERAASRLLTAPTQALALAERAMARLTPDVPAATQADAHWALGLAQTFCGHPAQALEHLHRALARTPDEDLRRQVRAMRGLSTAYEHLGERQSGLHWAMRALDVARQLGTPLVIADATVTAGVACSRAGNVEQALAHYEQALMYYEAAGDQARAIMVLNNLGVDNRKLERYEEARAHFERAIELADNLHDGAQSLVPRANLAELLMRMGQLRESRGMLAAVAAAAGARGLRNTEIEARLNLGRALTASDRLDAAQRALNDALRLQKATAGRRHLADIHLALSGLYKRRKQYQAALVHYEAYHLEERSRFDERSARALNALRVRHELQEAHSEAQAQRARQAALQQSHAELQSLHARLLAADREKDALLERLAEQSRTDPLTGVLNRRRLDERLAEECMRAQRNNRSLAVAMLDIDNFKVINDTWGHQIGDEVLRGVAVVLKTHCRATDLVARYGGEEFCIVFLEADASTAVGACDALRSRVEVHDWSRVQPGLRVTLSIGVTDFADAQQPAALIGAADMLLYQAKRHGKNQVFAPSKF